jgi:hypothetical protein
LCRGEEGLAVVKRQAAAEDRLWLCRHRCPRGTEDARSQLCLMRAERGNPARVRHLGRPGGGRPTVRGAEFPGGNRMPKKRMPVAERQQESGTVMAGSSAGRFPV